MKFNLVDKYADNEKELMRKCGYFLFYNRKTKKYSYIRKLSNIQDFPRFHIFIERTDSHIKFDLHLDQKKTSYSGYKAHSGEKDSEVVMREIERIKNVLN